MGKSSISLKFTIFLSLSLSVTPFALFTNYNKPPPIPKATPSDLLNLLGSKSQASSVNPGVAKELKSCFKFLVPFHPTPSNAKLSGRRSLRSTGFDDRSRREEDELVWWPPQSVLELARLGVDSGGDPGAIHRTLDPAIIPIPDIHGSQSHKCELTRTPYGRRFISEELNSYLQVLFELIATRSSAMGINIKLNRFDLFHGHLFLAFDNNRLGILFHAKEFPAYDKKTFPCNMGYCQIGSNVSYDDSMNLRNILWLAPMPSSSTKDWEAPGVLVVLDAHPDGIIYRDIIPDYVHIARTIYEDDLGDTVVDVNYLDIGNALANYQIFIC
ncbi:T-box protein 41 [Cucumis melo var. makuwa]|uniref:T-box protein 41 n=1 Tax=Cucumis melo var. makuwa TaxID=1194695 RepID=A0A5D3CG84_CUCMM|nr:T-box protein 41 [Cucumis melo var. makuwa]TYK10252.1 T-box protein 41 [Cucumis melo var. makuwa]